MITEKELELLSDIEIQNEFILIKPLALKTNNILAVTVGEKGKIEEKKTTKGVILKKSNKVKDYEIGDIVGWSINAVFYRIIEIETEMYLLLNPNEIAYVIRNKK